MLQISSHKMCGFLKMLNTPPGMLYLGEDAKKSAKKAGGKLAISE
jgi:hypothetical protein